MVESDFQHECSASMHCFRLEAPAVDGDVFESVFAQCPDYCAVLDRRGFILRCNSAWRALGWALEALEGVFLAELLHAEDRALAASALAGGVGEEVAGVNIRLLTPAGAWRRCNVRIRAGAGGRYAFFGRDLSMAESLGGDARREVAARSQVEAMAGVGLWADDGGERRLIWSAGLYDILGEEPFLLPPSRRRALDYVLPVDRARVVAAVTEAQAKGEPFDLRLRIRRCDGAERWLRFCGRGEPAAHGGEGAALSGLAIDITEDIRREEMRRASQRRLAAAFSALGAAIIEYDLETRELYLSPNAIDLIGHDWSLYPRLSPANLFRQLLRNVVPTLRNAAYREWKIGLQNARGFNAEHCFRRPNGTEVWVRDEITFERDSAGAARRCVCVMRDVSAQRRVEDQSIHGVKLIARRAAQSKSELMTALAHDFGAPLNGISAFAAQAERASNLEAARAPLRELRAASAALNDVLSELRDLARMESNSMVWRDEDVSLAEIAEDLARRGPDGAAVELAIAPGARGLCARGDRARLAQGVALIVREAAGEAAGPVRISVAALALPVRRGEAEQSLILDVQWSVPMAKASSFARGGLMGRTLARAIAERCGGALGGDFSDPHSPRLWLSLPARAQSAAKEAGVRHAGPIVLPFAGRRILVVEDHVRVQAMVAGMLKGLGAEPVIAADGEEGVAAAEGRAFDAILMDIKLPLIDGAEAVRRIQTSGGPNRAAPIIALTGACAERDTAYYSAIGMKGLISKPIRTAEFLRVLATAIAA